MINRWSDLRGRLSHESVKSALDDLEDKAPFAAAFPAIHDTRNFVGILTLEDIAVTMQRLRDIRVASGFGAILGQPEVFLHAGGPSGRSFVELVLAHHKRRDLVLFCTDPLEAWAHVCPSLPMPSDAKRALRV